jgi:uncharacterized UBP type Zn finger protein
MTDFCTHLDTIRAASLPEGVPGCEDCRRIGGSWVYVRLCLTCGHIGCCDPSPNAHATAHARSSHHPVIRWLESGEEWCWCYVDEIAFRVDLAEAEA